MKAGRELEERAKRLLHDHGFLVHHLHTVETSRGWRQPEAGDVGYFDLTAIRPGVIIFVECKDGGRPNKEQQDWQAAGQGHGEGVYCAILTPLGWPAFEAHVKLLDGPSEDWSKLLAARKWRADMKKGRETLGKVSAVEGPLLPEALTARIREDWGFDSICTVAAKPMFYRGHQADGSICVFGPLRWNPEREKFTSHYHNSQARFRCLPASEVKRGEPKNARRPVTIREPNSVPRPTKGAKRARTR